MHKALKKGIDVPVVAGIMPVTNASQIKRSMALTGNLVPRELLMLVDRFGDSPEAMMQAGIAYATEQSFLFIFPHLEQMAYFFCFLFYTAFLTCATPR